MTWCNNILWNYSPIPDIWTTFVPAKMVHIGEKCIREIIFQKSHITDITEKSPKKQISEVHISGIGCTHHLHHLGLHRICACWGVVRLMPRSSSNRNRLAGWVTSMILFS